VESLRGEFTLTAALLLLFDFGFEKRVGAGAEISKHFDIFKGFLQDCALLFACRVGCTVADPSGHDRPMTPDGAVEVASARVDPLDLHPSHPSPPAACPHLLTTRNKRHTTMQALKCHIQGLEFKV
jgi:hypothetical protein